MSDTYEKLLSFNEKSAFIGYVWQVKCLECGLVRNVNHDKNNILIEGQECYCVKEKRNLLDSEVIKANKTFLGMNLNNLVSVNIYADYFEDTLKVLCRCNTCGSFKILNYYKWLDYCYKCNCATESKGAHYCRDILRFNNTTFGSEVTFNDLLSEKGNKLRVDFIIYSQDMTSIIGAVEYDGTSHRKKHKGMTENDFLLVQEHDKIKDDYFKKYNIPLLRIPSNLDRFLFTKIITDFCNKLYNNSIEDRRTINLERETLILEEIATKSTDNIYESRKYLRYIEEGY